MNTPAPTPFEPEIRLPRIRVCPVCSTIVPGKTSVLKRPTVVKGQRSGVFMLVTDCPHGREADGEIVTNNADPVPLVVRWNDWAERAAQKRALRLFPAETDDGRRSAWVGRLLNA